MKTLPILCALSIGASLAAQQTARDTAKAEPVVVTATRTPMTPSTLPVAVTVIDGAELRIRGVTTVADALREVTSAYLAQTGSQGGLTALHLRGGESKYVKVLIDGIAVNDPGGSFDFGSLTTDNVDRIEVVRGPASVIFGADAVTGVVNVITKRGVGKHHADVSARYGVGVRDPIPANATPNSARSLDASGTLSAGFDVGSYAVTAARHQTTGLYARNNCYLNNVFIARLAFAPFEGGELRANLHYNDYQFNYPTNSAGDIVDTNAYRAEDRTAIGLELERRFSPTIRAVAAVGSSINDGGTDDEMDSPTGSSFVSQDKTRRRNAEVRLHLLPVNSTALTLGVQMEQQDQRLQLQSQSSFGPFNSQFKAARRNMGLYGEAVLTPHPTMTFTVGARADHNQQFGDFGTYRAGMSWRPVEPIRVRATAGTAFREPLFAENFSTGFVTGNPKLQPERSRVYDAGVDADLLEGRATVSLTAFAQTFSNMIDYTGSTTACGYSYCNVASARANGLEAEFSGRVVNDVWMSIGGTTLKTRVLDPGFDVTTGGLYRKGEPLIRRPEDSYRAALTYRGGGPLSANAQVLRVGSRSDRDFHFPTTPVTLKGYTRVDAGVEYSIRVPNAERTALTLSGENLTNMHYQNVYNFFAPRRTLYLGIRATM